MVSQFDRYAYVGNIYVHTYRNLFKNDVPLGLDLFTKLKTLFDEQDRFILSRPPKNIFIKEFELTADRYAEILFHAIDPSIPDNVLANRNDGTLRKAQRKDDEDPAISAHVLIDLDEKFNQSREYPALIENVDYLSRSYIVQFMDAWMDFTLSEDRLRPGEKATQKYRPTIKFHASPSQKIQNILEAGGVLKGVKYVETQLEEQTFGDEAYPVIKRKDIGITVKNRPGGNKAVAMLKSFWESIRAENPETFKVIIEDTNHRSKTLKIDTRKNNILSNFFISQVLLNEFGTPLAMCEENIRRDVIDKMKSNLPNA